MKNLLLLFFLVFTEICVAQITGKVIDQNGEAVPFVNIYLKNTYVGTTSNTEGVYQLDYENTGETTVVFKFLGFKTLEKQVNITSFPYELNVTLEEETTSLNEVIVRSWENPAMRVIRKAIEYRKQNLEKIEAYTADFYSRGLWKIQNAPEKILGQEVGDLGGGLDSTRSGIIYLSETISKIKYQKPDNFYENITASKVSGQDNGFSVNSAEEADFNFYENTININTDLISPIANYALNYYEYKLEGIFYDENQKLINKIEVLPKRVNDPVFSGYIYIVEDDWEIYGVELKTTGKAVKIPPLNDLIFKQNYSYNPTEDFWVKLSQTIDFDWKIFGISGDGRFTASYSNYEFHPRFDEKTFTKEILKVERDANKKDSLYWEEVRPVPLTLEEQEDYTKKDSIQERKNSKVYKDSIDQVNNKFKLTSPIFGYTHQNSHQNNYWGFSGPIGGIHYNTVQGWKGNVDVFYRQDNEEKKTYWRSSVNLDYGLSEERFRAYATFFKKFNNFSKPYLSISSGVKKEEYNDTDALPLLINDITTLFFQRNYLKLYEKVFTEVAYSQEVVNGVRMSGQLSYEKRNPLFNNEDYVIIPHDDKVFTSNNPLAPNDFTNAAIEEHQLAKFTFGSRINFGQEYLNYPDEKYNIPSDKFPTLFVNYEKGFASNNTNYHYDLLKIAATQQLDFKNKGDFDYFISAGKFFGADRISFVDYQHFRGNQTRLNLNSDSRRFNLLPYYALSTNQEYAQLHAEHSFDGWVLGKIPLVRKLNFNLVLGYHGLATTHNQAYNEINIGLKNIGIGKFRFLRVDYVKPYFGGWQDGAFVFGFSL
ncbi:DUF5686 and carboxypeptidase regulatory-like domain-containing protein [Mesonia sp. K7]|uniref:DUF5686 and carboxypeptidase regulatory-like domain-containing protein n=1 Tax=Mesonia sp. K7 TaxID=2218606 RepID=UPI00269EB307